MNNDLEYLKEIKETEDSAESDIRNLTPQECVKDEWKVHLQPLQVPVQNGAALIPGSIVAIATGIVFNAFFGFHILPFTEGTF